MFHTQGSWSNGPYYLRIFIFRLISKIEQLKYFRVLFANGWVTDYIYLGIFLQEMVSIFGY
jgi:hypothetical protein